MHERPQAALFEALRHLGYRVLSSNDKLPATIQGAGPRQAACEVSINQSSQFASALLLCSGKAGWTVGITGQNSIEAPYVKLTEHLVADFPESGGNFVIEPDASSASYFWGIERMQSMAAEKGGSSLQIERWPGAALQIDQRFPELIQGGASLIFPKTISRENDLGDSIMTAIVLAPFAAAPVVFTDLHRLRLQECERVQALRTELSKCGARAVEQGESLTVYPSSLHGAEIETYDDHRMGMCFAILGLKVPGIKLKNPACVKKTFPNFFQKLAGKPPHGLGMTILDAQTRRPLDYEELFAE
jgi:3-phosphoshikimate 1-carboxyvinyltransferase